MPEEYNLQIRPNDKYTVARTAGRNCPMLVTIPKTEIASVPVAYYTMQQEVKFMPVVSTVRCSLELRRIVAGTFDSLG